MKKLTRILITLLFSISMVISLLFTASAADVAQVKSLKAKSTTYNSVTLTWKAVSDITGYEVQQYSNKAWKTIKTALTTNTYTVKKLKTGTTYKFRVRAYKTTRSFFTGERTTYGSYSKSLSVKPIPSKVKAKVSSVTINSAKLTWSKVSGASGYYVQKKSGKTWKTVTTLKSNVKSYTIKKLTLGKTYTYRVVAYRTVNKKKITGTPSSSLTVKPAVPTPTSVSVSNITTSSATISWKKSTGATGYQIQLKNGKNWKTVSTVKSKTKATVSIVPGTEYEFRVRAYKGKYYSNGSSSLKVKYTVNAAKGLKVSSVTKEKAVLTWTAAKDVAGYEVQILENKQWKKLATVTSSTYTASVIPGTEYSFRVLSYVKVGDKNYYGAATNTVTSKYTVPAAKDLKVSSTAKDSATLTWTAASGVSGYEVQKQEGSSWKTVATVTTNSYTASTVPGAEYTFRVVSFVTVGGKNYSAAASNTVTSKYTVPAAKDLKVSSAAKDGATLTWTAASGVSGYEVQKQEGSSWKTIATVTTNSYTASTVPDTEYTFRVVSFVTVGGKNYSAAASNTVTSKYTVPAAKDLKVSSAAKDSAALTWTAASGVSGYEVQKQEGSSWETIATVTTNSYTASTVPGTEYTFRVVSFVTVQSKNYYGTATNSVTSKYTVPAAKDLKVSSVNETSVTLTWTAANSAEGYTVYSGNNAVATVKGTSATITGLSVATSYSFSVKATQTVNSTVYYSAASNTVNVKTSPDKVSGFAYSNLAETSATLTWNAAAGADGYTVYKLNSSNGWDAYKSLTATSLSLTGLKGNTAYQFKVAPYHNVNGFALYGQTSAAVSFTTCFDTIENLTTSDINSSYAIVKVDWSKIEGATYEAYTSNTINTEWVAVNEEYASRDYYYLNATEEDFGFKAEESNYKINATWNAVSGASKYAVQTRTNGVRGSWVTKAETTGTSASFAIAPSTEYEVRVVVYNGSFKVRAVKGGLYTAFAQLNNIPGSISEVVTVTTADAPTFNKNDKNIKTAYVLKAIQAINNTKAESTIASVTKKEVLNTAVDSLEVNAGALTLWQFWDISKIPGIDVDELAGVKDELDVNETYTGYVSGGVFVYTLSDGTKGSTSISKAISPYSGDAYLYNVEDVNSINNKITDISYSKNGTTETIVLTLAQEVATKANDATPVHKGLYEDFSGTASAQGMDDGRVTVGPTKITVVINEKGTLNSMNIKTTFDMYSQMTEEGISFRMSVRGTNVEDTYTFVR